MPVGRHLAPGAPRTNAVANQRFRETSAVPGAGLSITGQRVINNGFVVDGLSSNDDAADLAGTMFSQEIRREFEVIAEGFNVLNRANLQLPYNVFGTVTRPQPGFGLPTAADNPRQVQFGLRLNF